MKSNIIIRILMALAFCFMLQNLNAQPLIGSMIAGANFAQIEGDGVHGFHKVGFNGGLGLTVPVNRKQTWQVSVEMLYSMKGAVKRCRPGYFNLNDYALSMFTDVDRSAPFDPTVKCNISLDYLQIPVMVHYEGYYLRCTFGLGFAWSRLVRAHEVYNGFTRTINAHSGTYRKSDWSVIADINFHLSMNLKLNLRYEYSLVPIRVTRFEYVLYDPNSPQFWETHKYRNNILSLRLIYDINGKFYKNIRVNKYDQIKDTSDFYEYE